MAKHKKYHQNLKDREHESRGMKKHHKRHITKHDREMDRENLEHSRKSKHHSHHDGSYEIFGEDYSAPALLPRRVVEREFPNRNYGMNSYMDDLYEGVQKQLDMDEEGLRQITRPTKY